MKGLSSSQAKAGSLKKEGKTEEEGEEPVAKSDCCG